MTTKTRFRIVQFTNRGGSQSFRVTGSTREGRQIRQNFDTIETATIRQQELEREYLGLENAKVEFTQTRLTPEQVAQAEVAFNRLGDKPLPLAVEFFITNYRETAVKIQLSKALENFLEAKTKAGRRPDTLRNLEDRIGRFCRLHPTKLVSDVLQADVEAVINKGNKGAFARISDRRVLFGFFKWCGNQGYCGRNPVEHIETIKVDQEEPQILPLDGVKRLVQAAEAHKGGVCMPYVALGLFCAIRPTELARLSWNEIDLKAKTVTIGAKLAKMRQRRIVEIPKNAVQFLKAHVLAKTAIKGKNARRDFDAVKAAAGYGGRAAGKPELKPWTADVMRHTGISNHLAEHQHEGKTAAWAGNSPDVIQRHYKGLVNKNDTKAFWAIVPASAKPAKGKIIPMQVAA
ncbi:MAG: site-specific integrase [Verrucomicrobiota bacterium]|jgi:integrase